MSTPTSNISLATNVQAEFGGSTPTSLSEYYRSGAYVPTNQTTSGTDGRAIPSAGPVSLGMFRGITKTPQISYSVSPTASSVNEGSMLSFTVSTVGVADQLMYWTLLNNTTISGDFSASSGSFSLVNNTGSFLVFPVNDATTEGPETFSIQIRTGSTAGPVVATSSLVTVNDTSISPTYSISAPASVNEGSSATFTVTTSNVPNGTVLGWAVDFGVVSGDPTAYATAADISGAMTGTVTISGNTGTFSVSVLADNLTEAGTQWFYTYVYENGNGANIYAYSNNVQINDTSKTPSMSAAASPNPVNGSGGALTQGTVVQVTAGPTTVSPTGGTGPYTYLWTYLSGVNPSLLQANTSSTQSFRRAMTVPSVSTGFISETGVYRCTVTDSASHTAIVDVTWKTTCNNLT